MKKATKSIFTNTITYKILTKYHAYTNIKSSRTSMSFLLLSFWIIFLFITFAKFIKCPGMLIALARPLAKNFVVFQKPLGFIFSSK